jgi:hypothetical protein
MTWCWGVVHVGEDVNFSCLANTQHLCILSLYKGCHLSSVARPFGPECVACLSCCDEWCHSCLFSCYVGQKTVEATKTLCPTYSTSLVSCRTVLWVVVIEEHSKVVFLSKLPCHACIHCHHKACMVLFQILYACLVCTAETPLCPWISQLLHPGLNFLWGDLVWNMYYLGCRNFLWFSTASHIQDLICQVDFEYFQSEAFSLHA